MNAEISLTTTLPVPLSGVTMGIRTFGAWCKTAGVDEWTALVRVGGSPEAMIFLRFAMLWGEAAAVKAAGGWFYQTATDFAVNGGLTRRQFESARKDLKMRAGMVEQKRRIRKGEDILLTSCLHYRLDPLAVFARFVWECLPADHAARMGAKSLAGLLDVYRAELLRLNNAGLHELDKRGLYDFGEWSLSKLSKREMHDDDKAGSHDLDEHESTVFNRPESASKESPESHLNGERDLKSENAAHPGKDELPTYLHGLYDDLGTPNGSTAKVLAACEAIGAERAAAVAGRCEGEARTWKYVISAMEREGKAAKSTPKTPKTGGVVVGGVFYSNSEIFDN